MWEEISKDASTQWHRGAVILCVINATPQKKAYHQYKSNCATILQVLQLIFVQKHRQGGTEMRKKI